MTILITTNKTTSATAALPHDYRFTTTTTTTTTATTSKTTRTTPAAIILPSPYSYDYYLPYYHLQHHSNYIRFHLYQQ